MGDDMDKLISDDEIHSNLAHHPPLSDEVIRLHETVRTRCTDLSLWMNNNLPECDEKDEAIRAVRLACMWANGAVACHSNTNE